MHIIIQSYFSLSHQFFFVFVLFLADSKVNFGFSLFFFFSFLFLWQSTIDSTLFNVHVYRFCYQLWNRTYWLWQIVYANIRERAKKKSRKYTTEIISKYCHERQSCAYIVVSLITKLFSFRHFDSLNVKLSFNSCFCIEYAKNIHNIRDLTWHDFIFRFFSVINSQYFLALVFLFLFYRLIFAFIVLFTFLIHDAFITNLYRVVQ